MAKRKKDRRDDRAKRNNNQLERKLEAFIATLETDRPSEEHQTLLEELHNADIKGEAVLTKRFAPRRSYGMYTPVVKRRASSKNKKFNKEVNADSFQKVLLYV